MPADIPRWGHSRPTARPTPPGSSPIPARSRSTCSTRRPARRRRALPPLDGLSCTWHSPRTAVPSCAFLGDDPQSKDCSSWNPGYAADLHEVVTLDTATGLEVSSRQLTTPTRGAITAITPDGRIMAIADRKKTAQLWDLDSDKSLGNLPTTSATIYIAMGFSDDGQTLAIGRMDGTIDLWDVPGLRLVKTLRGNTGQFTFTMIRFSPDGRTLALTGYRWGDISAVRRAQDEIRRVLGLRQVIDPEIILLDIATGRRLAGAADSTCPLYSPDGRVPATGEPDGTTRLRDSATSRGRDSETRPSSRLPLKSGGEVVRYTPGFDDREKGGGAQLQKTK